MVKRSKRLDELLDKIAVHDPAMWENDTGPKGWYAVSTDDDGIIAYFHREVDAFAFRLALINAILNPIGESW